MAETIDRLQIEIEAKSSNANKALDILSESLEGLKKSLTGIDTSGLDKIHKALDGINSAAKSVSNTSVTPNVNTSNISSAEKKIKNAVESIQDKLIRLQNLEKAALGGDVSAVTSFKRQATSLQGDIDVVTNKLKNLGDTRIKSNAFTIVERQIERASNLLDALKEKSDKLYGNNTPTNDSNYVRLQGNIQKTSDILDGLIDKQREMIKDGSAYVDPMQKYREGVALVQKSLDSSKQNIDNFTASSKEASNSFDASKITSALSTVASTVKSTTKQLFSLVGKGIKAGINGLTNSFKALKNAVVSVRDHISKLTKWTDKGFMKILKYGFGIRSIYVGFRRLRKAVVESFAELQKSGAFYETTKKNVEDLKNSLTLLKYQFGAAFEPIFNAVAPALNTFVQHILKAMNAFSAFTAKLMGKDTYSRAVLDTSAIADNTKDAAKAQKELNKQLRGFDEINNLTTSTSGKGSGSGSSDDDDNNITYVTESVDNVLGDFGKELAKNIREGEWEAVGEAIGAKLTQQLNSIKWDTLKEKAANFGTNLGNFINGLISPDLFDAVGTTIGNAIGTALTGAFYLGETIKWDNVGESIGAFINGVVRTNPLKLAVEAFNVWANGILEALNKAVETVEWKTIGQHIATGIAAVDAWNIAWNLGKLVKNFANAFATLVSNGDTWKNLGDKIADGINGFFTSMNDPIKDGVNKGLTGWEALGKGITNTIVGIADTITVALEKTDWEAVGQAIADFISNIDWKKIIWSLGKMLDALWEAFKGILRGAELDAGDIAVAIGGIALVINTIAGIKLASGISSALLGGMIQETIVGLLTGGGAAGATEAVAGGAAATSGAVASVGIGSVLATIGKVTIGVTAGAVVGWQAGKNLSTYVADFLKEEGIISNEAGDEYISNSKMSFTEMFSDIKLAAQTDNLKTAWNNMWDEYFEPLFSEGRQIAINVKNFALKVAGEAKSVKEAWSDFWGDVGEAVYDTQQSVTIKVAGVIMKIADKAKSAKEAWNDFWGDIGEAVYDTQKSVTIKAAGLLLNIGNKLKSAKEAWIDFWGDIGETVYDTQKSVTIKTAGIIIKLGDKLQTAKEAWTEFWGNIGESVFDKTVSIKTAFEDTKTTLAQKWSNIQSGIANTSVSLTAKVKAIWEDSKSTVESLLSGQKSNVYSLVYAVKAGILEKKGNIATWLSDIGKDVTSLVNISKIGTLKEKGNIATWLSDIGKNVTSYVNVARGSSLDKASGKNVTGWLEKLGTSVTSVVNLKKGFGTLRNFIKGNSKSTKNIKYETTSLVTLTKNGFNTLGGFLTDNPLSKAKKWVFSVGVKVVNTAKAAASKVLGWFGLGGSADGGVFAHGIKHKIPQFANGTTDAFKHGSVFVAGESGPEIAGHINGRTEILNKSQLASTMYTAITRGMAQFKNAQMVKPNAMKFSGNFATGIADGIARANDNTAMEEQNRLLEEQNRLLRQILNKPSGITSRDVFNATRAEAQQFNNQTGRSPFIF